MLTTILLSSGVADTRHPEYQALKGRIHKELLNRLDLARLSQVKREDAEPELRGLIVGMLEREEQRTPLSLAERENLVLDVLNELFGLGPLEELLRDPAISDILVNRHDQVYIEREGRLESTNSVFRDDRHLLQIIERIVSSVGRRIDESSPMVDARLQDGSRVNADHSAAGARRSRAVDSPVSNRPPGGSRSRRARFPHEADAGFPCGCRVQPAQRDCLGRHRRRKDDAAERPLRLHRRQGAGDHD